MNDMAQNGQAKAHESDWATHMFLFLCVAMCGAIAAWAYYGKLDVVSMATGEVVPFSQIKTVQHLEGGIVSEILVREGEEVKRGQPIVVLEATASGADVGELQINVTSLRVEIARLEAEASGADKPVFADDLMAERADLVSQAVDFFDARRDRQNSQIASQTETIVQRQQDIREITARVKNQKNNLELLDEQIAISVELMKEDLTNRYNHLELLKDASQIKGRIEEDTVALLRSRAALKEARAEMDGINTSFKEQARKEMEDKRRRLNELHQRLEKFEDSLQRTTLRSPVDGVVKTLYVFTRGGVVRPGGDVVEIRARRGPPRRRSAPSHSGYRICAARTDRPFEAGFSRRGSLRFYGRYRDGGQPRYPGYPTGPSLLQGTGGNREKLFRAGAVALSAVSGHADHGQHPDRRAHRTGIPADTLPLHDGFGARGTIVLIVGNRYMCAAPPNSAVRKRSRR